MQAGIDLIKKLRESRGSGRREEVEVHYVREVAEKEAMKMRAELASGKVEKPGSRRPYYRDVNGCLRRVFPK